jgi:hypothetical protein
MPSLDLHRASQRRPPKGALEADGHRLPMRFLNPVAMPTCLCLAADTTRYKGRDLETLRIERRDGYAPH